MAERIKGVVKFFNADKGYGFITVPGMDKDVFLHVKELRNSLIKGTPTDGTKLSFVIKDGNKGKFATELKVDDA